MVDPQSETINVPVSHFLRNPEFQLGFTDKITGREPRFDQFETNAYEIGRIFAVVAPPGVTPAHRGAAAALRLAFLNCDIPDHYHAK